MTSSILSLLNTGRRLHRLLNSARCPDDIDEQHRALFAAQQDLRNHTVGLFEYGGGHGYLHDSYVRGFSERRTAQGWRSHFHADAPIYNTAGDQLDWARFTVRLETKRPLRGISGREIYTVLVDPAAQQIGFSVHRPTGGMIVVVAPYTALSVAAAPLPPVVRSASGARPR